MIGREDNLKRKWLGGVAFFSQVVILLALNATGRLVYATNDDTTIVALASGGFGSPSEYVVHMNILIGYVLRLLFDIWGQVNWVTVFYVFMYLAGALLMDIVFLRIRKNEWSCWATILLVDIAFLVVISYFTFTVMTYWATMAAILAMHYGFHNKGSWGFTVAGILLLMLASCVRVDAIKAVVVIYAGVALPELICNRNARPLVIAVIAVSVVTFLAQCNQWLSGQNPIQKEYLQWSEARGTAMDFAKVPFEEHRFADAGITIGQYNASYNAFYYIRDAVSTDLMKGLAELNTTDNLYNFDVLGILLSIFSVYREGRFLLRFEYFYRTLFAVVVVFFALFGRKQDRLKLVLIWGATLTEAAFLFFVQRAPYRVLMPTYVVAAVLILMQCHVDLQKLQWFSLQKISFAKMILTLTVILSGIAAYCCGTSYSLYKPWKYGDEQKAVLQYMSDNNQKLFLAGEANVLGIGVADSVWDHPGNHGGWNLIGNWETFSVPYYTLMEKKGIQNPDNILYEALNNDNILILSQSGDAFPGQSEWILDLVEEYYGIRPYFEKVDDVSVVNTGTGEIHWVTYRLVY